MSKLVPCCDAHAEYIAKLRDIELKIKILKDEIVKLRSSWKYHHKIIEINGWELVPDVTPVPAEPSNCQEADNE